MWSPSLFLIAACGLAVSSAKALSSSHASTSSYATVVTCALPGPSRTVCIDSSIKEIMEDAVTGVYQYLGTAADQATKSAADMEMSSARRLRAGSAQEKSSVQDEGRSLQDIKAVMLNETGAETSLTATCASCLSATSSSPYCCKIMVCSCNRKLVESSNNNNGRILQTEAMIEVNTTEEVTSTCSSCLSATGSSTYCCKTQICSCSVRNLAKSSVFTSYSFAKVTKSISEASEAGKPVRSLIPTKEGRFLKIEATMLNETEQSATVTCASCLSATGSSTYCCKIGVCNCVRKLGAMAIQSVKEVSVAKEALVSYSDKANGPYLSDGSLQQVVMALENAALYGLRAHDDEKCAAALSTAQCWAFVERHDHE